MRAVNLIPAENRRAGGGGVGAYILLGVLAVLVIMAGVYALTTRTVNDRKHELADVQAQATAAEAQVQSLQAYTAFADLSRKRVTTIKQLAESRFDWAHAMHEVARTIPSNAILKSLRGTVATTTTLAGGGSAGAVRNAIEAPAIELVGCTTSQSQVATMMSAMRRIDGVQRVTLVASEKPGELADANTQTETSGSGNCGTSGVLRAPEFQMVVFFTPTPASTPSTDTATSSTTPASSTTSADGSSSSSADSSSTPSTGTDG